MMKLTSVLMLVLGYWLLFAAHALAAGRQPGIYFPWESPPPPPSSWDHTNKDDRHVIVDHTGPKDKGKAKISGSSLQGQDADNYSSSKDGLSSSASHIFDQANEELDVQNVRTLAQWNLDDIIEREYRSPMLGPVQHSTLGEWDDQLMENQPQPGQYNSPYSEHLPCPQTLNMMGPSRTTTHTHCKHNGSTITLISTYLMLRGRVMTLSSFYGTANQATTTSSFCGTAKQATTTSSFCGTVKQATTTSSFCGTAKQAMTLMKIPAKP
ncbi:hypothetical protein FA10DRAFT_291536 [Acaromyces ingoldii]|uniref:Uncharacterized protein n=1 Tax=Acaromyces ingoldii TaxID=215250 RepID=A0A316YZ03_9BASI|nr:hypothetical protein FA10DRAFT_291536 [Acaromyces ingoldii]PWN94276.1 hypothetical protein FA10DRAFT_291536 [Acaromyces ingoldii]